MNLRAISLDLDNTLIDRDGAARAWWVARLRAIDAPPRALDEVLALDDHGHGPRDVLFRTAAERYPQLGSATALWAAFRAEIATFVRPDPAVGALLDHLRGRYRVALLTDGGEATQRAKLAAAGLSDRFDAVFISEATGVKKPHRRAFQNVATTFGVPMETILHAGDHPVADVEGAQGAGLHPCFVGLRWPVTRKPPIYQVARFLDLPQILPC